MKIVYEMKDGTEMCQECQTEQEWIDERAQAEREVASNGTYVAGYRMEYGSCEEEEEKK